MGTGWTTPSTITCSARPCRWLRCRAWRRGPRRGRCRRATPAPPVVESSWRCHRLGGFRAWCMLSRHRRRLTCADRPSWLPDGPRHRDAGGRSHAARPPIALRRLERGQHGHGRRRCLRRERRRPAGDLDPVEHLGRPQGARRCVDGFGTCAFPSALADGLRERGITPLVYWQPTNPGDPGAGRYERFRTPARASTTVTSVPGPGPPTPSASRSSCASPTR